MAWSDRDPAPLLGPEVDRDYLELVGFGLLILAVVSLVALAAPSFFR